MSSLNYAIFSEPFNLDGTFRVLRMTGFPTEPFYYDEVAECGTATNATQLTELIATANSLRFADFGNGLLGVYGECSDFHFCAVPEHTTEHKGEFLTETLNQEDIF